MNRCAPWLSLACLLATGCAVDGAPAETPPERPAREVLIPSPNPPGRFSPAIRAGNVVFLSGQLGRAPGQDGLVEGGIGPETRQTLENIRGLLADAGLDIGDLVKCTVFLADIADYGAMNEVYVPFFAGVDPPARSAVAVKDLVLGARVEIECIAAIDR